MFCLRVMVGVIILYDHVHPIGAFNKASTVDVSTYILKYFQFHLFPKKGHDQILVLFIPVYFL